MAAKYRKVDPRIWDDEKFSTMKAEEKLLALYCLTGQQVNRIGIYRLSVGMASEHLDTVCHTLAIRIGKVSDTLNWRWDATSKVLYLPTWWKYNPCDNSKHLLGCLADLHDVPQSPLVDEFCDNLAYLKDELHEHFRKGIGYRIPYRMAYQKQKQEQKQEQELSPPTPSDANGDGTPAGSVSDKPKRERFVKPTIEEVREFCRNRNNGIDAEEFIAFYESKGWMVGKSPMKNWRSAVVTWEKTRAKDQTPTAGSYRRPQLLTITPIPED